MSSTVRVAPFILTLLLNSCASVFVGIPTVTDEKLERYVTDMGLQIVAVSEHRGRSAGYQFRLADFARRDILGLSTGGHRVYISYALSQLAYEHSSYRWLLRQTLAHEIAHDVLGKSTAAQNDKGVEGAGLANRITSQDIGLPERIRFRPYGRLDELAADRRGMEYWRKLGWDCSHWVSLFMDFVAQGYEGDVDHPTRERLQQAIQLCSAQTPTNVSQR